MSQTGEIHPAIAQAERAVFDQTSAVVLATDSHHSLVMFQQPLETFITRAFAHHPDETTAQQHLLPALADLYAKGILEFRELEGARPHERVDNTVLRHFDSLKHNIDNPAKTETVIHGLANAAFAAVLLRPKGLVVPAVSRPWHASDMDYTRTDSAFVDMFRHRRNALLRATQDGQIGPRDHKHLQMFVEDKKIKFDEERIADFLTTPLTPAKHKTIAILTRYCLGFYAQTLLQALELDPDLAEEARQRFIARGYEILSLPELEESVGSHMFDAVFPRAAKKHILQGDQRGGGHHIPTLNPEYAQVIGPIEYIHAGVEGSDTKIPVALLRRTDAAGRITERVETFFPLEWTAEQVVKCIQYPGRILFTREVRGHQEEYFHSHGVLMKRICQLFHDDDEAQEIITAFPAVHIPSEVEKKLRSAAKPAVA